MNINKSDSKLVVIGIALCVVFGISACTTSSDIKPENNSIEAPKTVSKLENVKPPVNASLDTPQIIAALEKMKELAGNDRSLLLTKHIQSKQITPIVPAFDREGLVEPTQIFDNLYFIGNANVGVFVFSTSEGYIMIDSGYDYMVEDTILPGMKKLGLDPSQVKYILLTHAGPDHAGGLEYFQKNFGTRIVLSKEEWNEAAIGRGFVKATKDIVAIDGGKVTLGDTSILMVSTPRRVNGGGFSYMAQVFDNGKPHMWATYGNTNVVGTVEDKKVYRESVAKFIKYVDEFKVDVVISNHPFVDGSPEIMEKLKSRKPGQQNPFVLTHERARRFFELLDQSAVVLTLRQEAGLDETGTKPASEADVKPWDRRKRG